MEKEPNNLLLDYYMYEILDKLLDKEARRLVKEYGAGIMQFSGNMFTDYGQVCLTRNKLQEIKEKHDILAKIALGSRAEE